MAKARQAKARSESQYVVAPTSAGPVLGQVVKESATGVVVLRLPDGSNVEAKLEGRVQPSADPAVFGQVPFAPPITGEDSGRLDVLLELFRNERKTADERREWAAANGAVDLPVGKEVDELLRFRYEQHRAEWSASLREIFSQTVRSGNDRLLLTALEPSVPTDPRRLASEVALEQRVTSAIPALCAAAIHKSQTGFARDAVCVLQTLAPERLPLIRVAAQREVVDLIDEQRLAELPEAQILSGALTGGGVAGLRGTVEQSQAILHLALALPVADQARLFGPAEPSALVGAIREALRDAYRAVKDKESPTGYELLLRTALAQLVLADPSDSLGSDLRASAARVLVRDADVGQLHSLVQDLPDGAALLLVRTGMSSGRDDRSNALLRAVAQGRPALAAKVAPIVRAALSNGELDSSRRVAAFMLLAADRDSHRFVSREVGRELGRERGGEGDELALALVRNEVPLELLRVRAEGRAELLGVLPVGSARYAAAVLRALKQEPDAESSWSSIKNVAIPKDWITGEPDFRAALLEWLEAASAATMPEPMRAVFLDVLEIDAPTRWASWPSARREAAVALLAELAAARSAPVIAAIAARLEPGDPQRAALLALLAGRLIAVAPETLDSVSSVLPTEELRLALLEQGADLDVRLAQRTEAAKRRDTGEGRRLAGDLRVAIDQALHALGREGQLGVLFTRLAEDVASLSAQDTAEDPDVGAYLKDFAEGSAAGAGQRGDALFGTLRHLGGRSRVSQNALEFFREQSALLLQEMTLEGLIGFVRERRKALDRLDLAAIEPVATALLRNGGDPSLVHELLGGAGSSSSVVNVAFGVWNSRPESALALLTDAGVDLRTLADAVASRATEWKERVTERRQSAGGATDLVRRLAPTLEAIESVLLNYTRVRRVLTLHGLTPVEPILGTTRAARELVPGTHRVIGLDVAEGAYEVLTQGLRSNASGEVLVPAAVVRRADDESLSRGEHSRGE